jgi:hypothetical protein
MPWRRVAPAAIALALAAAGCGSSKNATTTTTATSPSATNAQFVARADAICQSARAKLTPLQATLGRELQAEQASDTAAHRAAVAATFRQSTQVASPLLDRLRTIAPPPSDGAAMAKYLSGVASQITLIDKFADAVLANDAEAVTTLGHEITQGKASVNALARGLGFKICGSGT